MKLPKLQRIRQRKLLTQRELAKRAGVSPTTIVRIERDQVEAELRTVRKLADALAVDPEELMGDE